MKLVVRLAPEKAYPFRVDADGSIRFELPAGGTTVAFDLSTEIVETPSIGPELRTTMKRYDVYVGGKGGLCLFPTEVRP